MSDDWNPQIRPSYQFDFEDWVDKETVGDNAWVFFVPEALENGEDMSPDWFLQQSDVSFNDGNEMLEDFWARKAAQRGSWLAMENLATLRYELGHLDECMRWNQRLIACLNDSAASPDQLVPPLGQDELREKLDAAIGNVEWLESEGIDSKVNNPRDLGINRNYIGQQFTYCLKCGKWKSATALLDQCDDSVHVVASHFG